MIHTKHLTIMALALCISTQVFGVRLAHPALLKELKAYFAAHANILSKNACSVRACIEQGKDVDQEVLVQVLREMQEHDFGVRKQCNPIFKRARQNRLK